MTLTETFMDKLHEIENSGDPAPLVALFADDSSCQNLNTEVFHGVDGAHQFWSMYLRNFETIHSDFFHHNDDGQTGTMEWTGKGQLKGGHPIEYRGISVIEYDGDKVKAFRTYYDSAAFIKPEAAS